MALLDDYDPSGRKWDSAGNPERNPGRGYDPMCRLTVDLPAGNAGEVFPVIETRAQTQGWSSWNMRLLALHLLTRFDDPVIYLPPAMDYDTF